MKIFKSIQTNLYAIIVVILCGFTTSLWSYSPFSTRELDELEKEFVQQINQSTSVVRNPLATMYINHLGRVLAKNSHLPDPHFFIVKSNEINAFAGPGGHIGINTQLILASDNEHELAAVMAHEMAHVRLHHLYRMIQHQKQMRIPLIASVLASCALGVLNPVLGSGALMASLTNAEQDSINYTRANEKEADRIGIDMLIKSGLDPKGMAAFFKKMQQHSRYYYTDNIPAILRTHPLDEARIAEAENRSTSLANKTYPDNPDYYLFKELIRNLAADDPKKRLDYYTLKHSKSKVKPEDDYGYALALIKANQYEKAEKITDALIRDYPDNIYFQSAAAQIYIGQHRYKEAIRQLRELHEDYPENYAALIFYAQGLISLEQPAKAASLLLKASRDYKQDLTVCNMLSRAQASSGQKGYAYFTQAQCELMQGRKRSAMQQLRIAKQLVKKDRFLSARITAKIDEIKSS